MNRMLSALSLVFALSSPVLGADRALEIAVGRDKAPAIEASIQRFYDQLRQAESRPREYSDDGIDESAPRGGSTTTTDTRINAPTSKQKTITTNTDSRSVTTVGPTTTKIGPSATTGASTASNGPIQVNPTINFNPTITIQNQGSNSADTYVTGRVVPVGPPVVAVPVPVAPACRTGVVNGLGLDGWGRPVALNVRVAPGVQNPVAAGPFGEPVLLPDGARVTVCGQAGTWFQIQVCNGPACVRGWASSRFIVL
jgi:hypothetical protein